MDFIPPFCPDPECPTHQSASDPAVPWYKKVGFRPTAVVGPVQRYVCRICRKGFSRRTFELDYWTHRTVDYRMVQATLVAGAGLRQAGRTLGLSTTVLANRHSRLSRQGLALHSRITDGIPLREDLVLDGLESFAFSQYFPNNLHLLAGADSQFAYGWNAAVLRRKGRMTAKQKARRTLLERKWKASPGAIYKSCRQLLEWGCHLSFGSLRLPVTVRTDEKTEYHRAISSLYPYGGWLEAGLTDHRTTSSRRARTLENPLFAVNYLDRQLRKDLAEHGRETVRFARRIEQSLERLAVHLVHHNYFKTFRTRLPGALKTHAEVAGVDRQKVLDLRERLFKERAFGWRQDLEGWAADLWRRRTTVPLHPVRPLAAHLMTA